jgi:hypothetical protein
MSKARITAAVVAMAMIGLPIAFSASAASAATSSDISTPSATEEPEFAAAEGGDGESDNHQPNSNDGSPKNHGAIPPVVIRPHEDGDTPDAETNDDASGNAGDGTMTDPTPNPDLAQITGVDPSMTERNSTAGDPISLTTAFSTSSRQYVVAPLNAGQNPAGSKAIGSRVQVIDPQSAPPVQIAGIQTSSKTPADLFMESATLGLAAMAVGALAFGGVAGVRAIRLRKQPNDDYFYDAN